MDRPAYAALPVAAGLLVLAILIFLFGGITSGSDGKEPSPVIRITQAVLDSPSGRRPVALPHVLSGDDFERGGSMSTFVLTLDLPEAPKTDLGVYINKVSLSGRVSVNGHSLGNCRAASVERLRCLHQPQFFLASRTLWRAGDNELKIEVYANANQPNGLSSVIVGPDAHIHSAYFRPAKFWSYDVIIALQWMVLVVGVLMVIIGKAARASVYGVVGLASILYSLASINSIMEQTYFSAFLTAWFVYSVRLASVCLMLLALLEFFAIDAPILKRMLRVAAILFPAIVAAFSNERNIVILLYAPLLLFATIVLFAVLRATYAAPRGDRVVVCLATVVSFLSGALDYVVLKGASSFEQGYVVVYTNAALVVLLGGALVRDLVAAHSAAITANLTLRAALAVQEEALNAEHSTMLSLEAQNTRIAERERLLREVHDGFGSTLAATSARLQDGDAAMPDVRQALAECMADLRIVLNATDPYATFGDAVGEIRHRASRLLTDHGVNAVWTIKLTEASFLSTSEKLSLARILQEALSNVVRHAQATRLDVACLCDPTTREIKICVRDDGVGCDVAPNGFGRGVRNMHARAASIGATLKISNGQPGTIVDVVFRQPAPALTAGAITGRST